MSLSTVFHEVVILEPRSWSFIKANEPYGAVCENTEHHQSQLKVHNRKSETFGVTQFRWTFFLAMSFLDVHGSVVTHDGLNNQQASETSNEYGKVIVLKLGLIGIVECGNSG